MAKLIKDLSPKDQIKAYYRNLKILGYLPAKAWKRLEELEQQELDIKKFLKN